MLENKSSRLRSFSQRKRENFGFSLVEMLVVFFIVAILASLVLAAYRTGQKRYALSQAAQQLVSDLRRAQNMAMGGIEIGAQYCGYGIEISPAARPTSYRFYADKKSNCQTTNNKYDASDDLLETVYLPQGIRIQKVSPPPLDIFFKPPEPTTYRNGNSSPGLTGTITLEIIGDSTAIKIITVTTAGLIQIN